MNQYVVIGTCHNNIKIAKIIFAENTSDAIVQAIEHEKANSGANFHEVDVIDTYGRLATVRSSTKIETANGADSTVNLVVQRRDGKGASVVSFKVCESVDCPEDALRNAIRDFIYSSSEESKKALSRARGYFNWGDALSAIPKEYYSKYGLVPILNECAWDDIVVTYDEVLDDRSEYQENEDNTFV